MTMKVVTFMKSLITTVVIQTMVVPKDIHRKVMLKNLTMKIMNLGKPHKYPLVNSKCDCTDSAKLFSEDYSVFVSAG